MTPTVLFLLMILALLLLAYVLVTIRLKRQIRSRARVRRQTVVKAIRAEQAADALNATAEEWDTIWGGRHAR